MTNPPSKDQSGIVPAQTPSPKPVDNASRISKTPEMMSGEWALAKTPIERVPGSGSAEKLPPEAYGAANDFERWKRGVDTEPKHTTKSTENQEILANTPASAIPAIVPDQSIEDILDDEIREILASCGLIEREGGAWINLMDQYGLAGCDPSTRFRNLLIRL